MHHQFNVTLTKSEADRALLRVFIRHGKGVLIGSLCLVGCVIFDFMNHGFGLAGYFSSVVLLLVWIWGILIIVSRRRRAEVSLRKLNGEAILYQLDDAGISASSALGQAMMAWGSLKEIWIYDDQALILFRVGGYFTIPRLQVSSEAFDFLVGRMAAHGSRIVDKNAKN